MHTKRLFVFVLAIAVFLAAPLSFAVTRVTMANGQESCVDSSHMQADIRFLARWGDGSKPNLAGGWRDFTTVSTKFFGIAEVSGTYPGEFFLQLMKGGRVVSRAKVTPAQGGLGAIFDAEYVDGVSLADTSGQIFARFARGKKGGPQLCIRYYRPDDKSEIEAINKTKRVILVKVESGDFAKEVRLGPGVLYDFAAEFSGRVSSSDPKSGQKMISGSWDWHRLPTSAI